MVMDGSTIIVHHMHHVDELHIIGKPGQHIQEIICIRHFTKDTEVTTSTRRGEHIRLGNKGKSVIYK